MGKKLTPPRYAELQVTTNFSFLRGASHGEELVAQAHALGLEALAVTDRNTLAGVVRAHLAAKELGLKLIVGARLDLQDAPSLLCLPRDRQAYGRLSRLLSLGQMRAKKGACTLYLDDVARMPTARSSSPCRPTIGTGAKPPRRTPRPPPPSSLSREAGPTFPSPSPLWGRAGRGWSQTSLSCTPPTLALPRKGEGKKGSAARCAEFRR